MPDAAASMLEQLGMPASLTLTADAKTWGQLKPGTLVAESSNLFPRKELSVSGTPAAAKPETKSQDTRVREFLGEGWDALWVIDADKPQDAPSPKLAEAKAPIDFEDFQKIDLRVATVLEASPVPKADKLLLVKLDTGDSQPRQVVAGIAEHWTPQQLVGRQVIVVANLKPRKLRGVESQGMILAVKREDGLELLTPSANVTPGSPVS